MKIFSAIRNNPFIFSTILLLTAFCFSHLPFFIWMDLPEVQPDTFQYYYMAGIFIHGPVSAIGAQPIEVPLGYPLFLAFTSIISNKLVTVIIMQSLVCLLSCLYLAYVCCKNYKTYGVLVSMALCIYLMNGFTIRWDTALYSESLYSSSLIILSAIFIQAVNKNSTLYFWLVGVWLFVPEFIRPNGLYVYLIIIPALFIYFFVRKEGRMKYFAIVVPAVVLNILWAGFNVKAAGEFIPGNFIRFKQQRERSKPPVSMPADSVKIKWPSKLENFKDYANLPRLPQFYYSLWTTRYENMYLYHQVTDTAYKMYNWSVPIPDSLRRFVYKEFYAGDNRFLFAYNHLKEHSGIRGIWLKAYHLWYKIDEMLLRNRLLFLVYIILSIIAVYKWISSGFREPVFLVLSVLSGLHIISIFVVTVMHPSVQLRYTHVSEFIVYVIFALAPLMMRENKPKKYA